MKPVAWVDPKELDMDVSTTITKNKQFDSDIPLYTAPRELSDEEIVNLYELLEYKNATSNEKYDAIQFARAILKKASEK